MINHLAGMSELLTNDKFNDKLNEFHQILMAALLRIEGSNDKLNEFHQILMAAMNHYVSLYPISNESELLLCKS